MDVCAPQQLTPVTAKRSALFNSGAEAVENAVKIARYATKRTAVVVLEHGYHGRTTTMARPPRTCPTKKASVRSRRRSTGCR